MKAITLQLKKIIFHKFEKDFLDSHMMNVVHKFECCSLNGVAAIEKTYIHVYPHKYKHPAELK